MPTVDDVARLAGVSRQTVSNVLNSPDIVREGTREKVTAAIATLGYRPHASAQRLRTRRSNTIGVRLDPMTNGISGSVLDRFLHAVTEQADARGLRVTLFTATDADHEIAQISRLWDGADVDAIVLTSTVRDDPRTRWLAANGVPFVTFGRPVVGALEPVAHPWVDVDGFAGLREATSYTIAEGARRVAYLGWPDTDGTGYDRYSGWHRAVVDQLGYTESDIAGLNAAVTDDVSTAREAMLAILAADAAVDAVVCASDTLAIGAAMAMQSAGRASVAVIGYDNTPVAQALGISSIEQPLIEVATGALELLFGGSGNALTASADVPGRLIAPRLVVRHGSSVTPADTRAGNHAR